MSEALPNGRRGGVSGGIRILSLCLPRLPTDRLIRLKRAEARALFWRPGGGEPPETPLAVVAKVKSALHIAATDALAEQRGIRAGMTLADARGAVPDLTVAEADPAAEGALLERVADWCDRYTPLVTLDPPHGLFLDISGCAHLFARQGDRGGEAALLADCLRRLASQGFAAQGAIAATAGAAWALAHHGGGGCVPPGGEGEALAGLPVAALRIADEQAELLDRLGLKRIGQLIGKPRAPLAARFGRGLIRRLDQALGHEDEVLSPRRPAPHLAAERRFAEPVSQQPALLAAVAALAGTLAPALERHGAGVRRIEATFFRTDGHVARAGVGTASPLRAPAAIARLFEERLAALQSDWDVGFGFDMVRLAVLEWQPFIDAQIDLSGEGAYGAGIESLVDRLGARLGQARITRWHPVDTHIPERAVLARPLAGAAAPVAVWDRPEPEAEAPPDRPLRLFDHPEPVDEVMAEVPDGPPVRFRWRRVLYEVRRAEGPERIAPEWWRAEDDVRVARDYFRVEDTDGRRYWLYREGLYDEMERPAWRIHGLFG